MIGQVGAALGEEHREAVGTIDQRHQHRGGRGSAFAAGQAKAVAHAAGVCRRGAREPRGDPGLLVGGRQGEQRQRHAADRL